MDKILNKEMKGIIMFNKIIIYYDNGSTALVCPDSDDTYANHRITIAEFKKLERMFKSRKVKKYRDGIIDFSKVRCMEMCKREL